MALAPLDPGDYSELVRLALAEDRGSGDITTDSTIDPALMARGVFIAKSDCVLAGLDVALEAFRQLDPSVTVTVRHGDGERCARGAEIAEIRGKARALLTAERTALNFLQRLSGIATLTRRFVDATDGRITVLDTRKTTPLLRVLEKYAVRAGGGTNHRRGLADGILIKDNHIRLGGGLSCANARARAAAVKRPVEIEAQSLAQVEEALDAGADIIMLDNLSTPEILKAVELCRGRTKTEISGGVTLERMPVLASTGADFVSIGALTHSAPAVDLSFEIEPV